jgi:hypothetical protein
MGLRLPNRLLASIKACKSIILAEKAHSNYYRYQEKLCTVLLIILNVEENLFVNRRQGNCQMLIFIKPRAPINLWGELRRPERGEGCLY